MTYVRVLVLWPGGRARGGVLINMDGHSRMIIDPGEVGVG